MEDILHSRKGWGIKSERRDEEQKAAVVEMKIKPDQTRLAENHSPLNQKKKDRMKADGGSFVDQNFVTKLCFQNFQSEVDVSMFDVFALCGSNHAWPTWAAFVQQQVRNSKC